MIRHACLVLAVSVLSLPSAAGTLRLEPDRDATLIEHSDGALANGSGPVLFAGRNNQINDSIRRGLLRFDVAGALPEDALVEGVSLTLYMTPSNPEPHTLRLYRVLADWGEGPSSASGGGGAPAQPGDVTWLHTFWDIDSWVHAGGQFAGRDSAALEVRGSGFYTWESTIHMVADVRLWATAPQRNFGWVLIGDELVRQSVKSFASREDTEPTLRPVLDITYRVVPATSGP